MVLSQKALAFLLALGLSRYARAGASHVPNGDRRPLQIRQDNSTRNPIDAALTHPNATGTWPINGIDLTKPLLNPPTDDYGPGNGWSINIAVATNVSVEAAPGNPRPIANPVRITIEGPGNVLEDSSTTANVYNHYEVCSFTWFRNSWTVEEMEKLQRDVNGSCNGVVSEGCIQDIREGLEGKPCGDSSSLNKPESCQSLLGPAGLESETITINLPNAQSADKRSITNLFESRAPYANTSEAGVRDVYNEAITNVYPMLLFFNYDNGETRSNYSVFRCIRANNVAEGSRQPDSFGSNRRSSAERASGAMLAAVMGLLFSVSVVSFL
ncbi:hypothetical protein LY78DRAFT_683443 [Colletotrichum sublineola]|uniref:Tat pathway signal sequence n=1 Tax=Colletotrichum sublineola TaxID=1173701 RepID=A0A066XHK7_COLSU|nr:hypothetical protein LY78DRAFT_683443 [Colletotrichum sublineola]KDN68422.1 hypothetical protein CSUB01_07543 [Colletotrichum sublineola]